MKNLSLFALMAVLVFAFTVSAAFALPSNQGIDKAKEKRPPINESAEITAPPEFVQNLPENQFILS